jgi:prevent-host-death family protein
VLEFNKPDDKLVCMKRAETAIGIFEAKTKLSELVKRVQKGQSFIITVRNHPVAELRSISKAKQRLTPGCGQTIKGTFSMAPDFDAPLADFDLDDA